MIRHKNYVFRMIETCESCNLAQESSLCGSFFCWLRENIRLLHLANCCWQENSYEIYHILWGNVICSSKAGNNFRMNTPIITGFHSVNMMQRGVINADLIQSCNVYNLKKNYHYNIDFIMLCHILLIILIYCKYIYIG